LALHHGPSTYDGWKISIKEENIQIYLDKAMYFQGYYHYYEQVHKINFLCLYWPTIAPKLILVSSFNNWVLEVVSQNTQSLHLITNWMNQFMGDLCHQKLIYDFSPLFVPKPWKLKKVKRNISKRFSWINSRFMSSLPSNGHEKKVMIKRLEIPKKKHVQLDCVS